MTTDLIKLKALATAAAANQYDAVALNDYGMAVPPATVLGLIAEIERHRLVNAEGCKPDSSILLSGLPCAAASCRSLNKAEGCKPDLNSPIHPDDMAAITKWHREFLQLTEFGWPDDASSLQDQAYALGRSRGQDDWLAERLQASAALRAELETVKRHKKYADVALAAQTSNYNHATAEADTLRSLLTIARAALQNVMNATDDSQDDGAHHKNAYSIADGALNNMKAACRHLNVAPRRTITDGKLIGYFCKDCGSPSASTELSTPDYPRVEIVRAHKHTCASCKDGADYGPCDCGAIIDGIAVLATLERTP